MVHIYTARIPEAGIRPIQHENKNEQTERVFPMHMQLGNTLPAIL